MGFLSERRMWSSYLSLGEDKRGSHSCPPSLLPPCSSTPAWWCSGTERYRRSLHRLGCNNTPSSPPAKGRVEALGWGHWRYYWLQMRKETFTLVRREHPPSGDSVKESRATLTLQRCASSLQVVQHHHHLCRACSFVRRHEFRHFPVNLLA